MLYSSRDSVGGGPYRIEAVYPFTARDQSAVERADKRQFAVISGVIHAIADNETVRAGEADEIG